MKYKKENHSYETMQWAADITHWLLIRVPPQMCLPL